MDQSKTTKILDISQIRLNPNNPRTIKDEKFKKLCKSLKENPEFLDARPIVVKDNMIIGGNMRYRALLENKTEIKPEWIKDVTGWTDEAIRKFIVVDNIAYGDNDWDILANTYEKEELEDWGMDVDKWVDDEVVEDEVPEVSTEEAVSKLGEIYQLGRHRILCGDSTKIEDVERLMDGKKADMVFTDPPYGMKLNADYDAMSKNSTKVKGNAYSNVIGDETDFDPRPLMELFGYCKEQLWWGADYYYDKLPPHGSWLIWAKRNENMLDIIGNHFEVCYSMNPRLRRIIYKNWSGVTARNPQFEREHPTEKPISLNADIIKERTTDDQIVVDLFLGSGSTLIACEQTNRICYGMEIDPKYIDVIRKRYAKFIGKEEEWEAETPRIVS